MRVYPRLEEENLRDQAMVRDWIASGFLNAEQGTSLHESMKVALLRTNVILRGVLFLFTGLVVLATVALLLSGVRNDSLARSLLAFCAISCLALSWAAASQFRLYRFGVEEALAVAAVVLGTASVVLDAPWDYTVFLGIIVASLASFGIYSLFGFRYALAGSAALAGVAPFALKADPVTERLLSLLMFGLFFFTARELYASRRTEIRGDDWAVAKSVAFAGFYLALNLVISSELVGLGPAAHRWFYWSTYAGVWIVPAAGLWLGIREKDRLLLDVASVAALATLITNKSYLGWERHTWDPILLGLLLIGIALILKRWLQNGTNGQRHGFTASRILDSENRALAAASAVSLAVPNAPAAAPSEGFTPGGGRSGGAGASGDF